MAEERKPQPLEHGDEEEEPPPHKVARVSSDEAGIVTMAAPSPLMLGLGLELGRGPGAPKPVFTFMQQQELEHQALIFKYMVAGLPVPVHLVLPIWKSVAASSFGPYNCPSCLMGYGSLCSDYRNSMEPEPGRCRRTDGKKWRCSRDVVPDQKYCERHMHRGRNRPRKPVEAGPAGGGAPTTTSATATSAPCSNVVGSGSSTQLSISVAAAGRQLLPTVAATITDANAGNSSGGRVSVSHASVIQNGTAVKQ